jgi:hypothetical protein
MHYEISYLTVVRLDLELYGELWKRGHPKKAVELPGGAMLILAPDLPSPLQGIVGGKVYRSAARWFWFNSATDPQQVVYGDGTMQRSPERVGSPPFTWIAVKATVERVGERYLLEALRSDREKDGAERLLYANMFMGQQEAGGHIFAGMSIASIKDRVAGRVENLANLENRPEWISLSPQCRVMFVMSNHNELEKGLAIDHRRELLSDRGVWRGADGSRPGEPEVMYSANAIRQPEPNKGWDALTVAMPILQTVHAVDIDGQVCDGIAAPQGTAHILIDVQGHDLETVFPSGSVLIFGD